VGHAEWRDGTWTLVLVRPLALEGGSSFAPGERTFAAFAVWQGGLDEVGARKSVTMTWTPIVVEEAPAPHAPAVAEARP
jgi:DMSO reductase family type II enzyme heme b subunit